MKTLLSAFIALIGLALVVPDADARRMGGGRNVGAQRQAAPPKPPAQQKATQNAPQQQQAAPAGAASQPATGGSRWLGPLAGLALGAGLFALFLNNGIAGVMAGLLLLAALAGGAYFLVRMLRSRAAEQPFRYAGAAYGPGGLSPRESTQRPPLGLGSTAASHSVAAATRWPADFDEAQFLRHARLNFVSLQAAHDRRDLSTIRDFLTPSLYREIEADVRAAGAGPHSTEVVTLEAEVIELVAEKGSYIATVRFSGLIREDGSEAQPFTELWHLEKPLTGRSGWLLAGIQQV
jgi:predicted lipid-binding transport protein (Tim44 family)